MLDQFFVLSYLHHTAASHRQFRHYYIYGKLSQCEQEQSNWTNCLSWRTTKDKEARVSLDLFYCGRNFALNINNMI